MSYIISESEAPLFERALAQAPAAQPCLLPATLPPVAERLQAAPVYLLQGEDFDFAPRRACAAGRCTVVDGCRACPVDPAVVARYAAAVAAFNGYMKPFTVVLALRPNAKVLRPGGHITMRDINSGVTYLEEALVILWRWDSDFWKVVTHELVHLTEGDADEARVEAKALRLWCAARAEPPPWLAGTVPAQHASYAALFAEQMAASRALAQRVLRTDATGTNEDAYALGSLEYNSGHVPHLAPRRVAGGGAGAVETFTVVPR
jgi:hypothetical protein